LAEHGEHASMADVANAAGAALDSGYASRGGLGLPGARRLKDEFEVDSECAKGTSPIASIEVSSDDFTERVAAVLVQLAEMASAAVERRSLYLKR
jgi:hypothetical protein